MRLINRISDIRSAAICSLLLSIVLTVRGATGQTIQLPAFQQRGLQTTVVVPDRGSISLGGFSGARQSRLRFAPPFFGPLAPSRALSGSRGVGNMQMRVWVHDLQAMDAAILTEASQAKVTPKKGGRANPLASRKPKPLPRLPAGN
ncbi:MAG: hypothetical protein CBB70_01740 [Planctomycetaceae bacterium TMED10]|nr:MAG: hypothetical protein CBB70_09465 [Planctomycetaceae bacterium TMED10]OUT70843.1 MAG: hypothetical protein CBB70_01740 [Planctomycetaceae bacterium TMED10]|tara:strand:+ start:400 stop:837 length:438 start_codon:yes stop_codon:yes gene_type:complete